MGWWSLESTMPQILPLTFIVSSSWTQAGCMLDQSGSHGTITDCSFQFRLFLICTTVNITRVLWKYDHREWTREWTWTHMKTSSFTEENQFTCYSFCCLKLISKLHWLLKVTVPSFQDQPWHTHIFTMRNEPSATTLRMPPLHDCKVHFILFTPHVHIPPITRTDIN